MASWAPQQQSLQEVLQMLHKSTDMNVAVQRAITHKLNNFIRAPEYIAYLAYILTDMPQEENRIRTIAGYLLKNNARLILTSTPEIAQYVKAAVLQAFTDESVMIRNAAACTEQSKTNVLLYTKAAFNVLEKACEDYPGKMDVEINGTRPLDFMIPKFLMLANHPSAKMRSPCGRLFIALVLLLAARPEKLMPEMNNVAEYMLYSTKDKNENVALEACEFWLTFAEDADLADHLHPLLAKVAPVLLDCMVYGEDDLLWLEGDAEDAAVPDKETDIKPRHYGGGKSHGLERDADRNEPPKTCIGAYGEETFDSDEEDYFDDEDFVDEMSTEWNLRKCAATTLDVLAVRFSGNLLNVLLGPLKDKLWSNDWLQRESGILALGAMAEGCIEAMEPHLPTLIPYLISTLSDSKPLIRSITCWTLGRYASWTTQPISEEHKNEYFVPTMEGLLRMVLDNNKRVQEVGCSAFATLEEEAGMELAPYLEPVLQNLVIAFNKYQYKNMLILYNAVGTLADAVGRALQNPCYVDILMPPLTKRWSRLKDDDENLIPLLECLASVTIAIGTAFLPYAQPVFERCNNIIHNALLKYQAYQENPASEEPDNSFLVVALDLLSGLTQGMGMELQPLITASNPPLLALLTVCLKHPQAPVRQTAYALVGDMAVGCFVLLRPYMAGIMAELTLQLDPEPKYDFISASNNAAWSVGEVSLRYGRDDPEFKQWVNPLIVRLIPILLHPKGPRSLHENAAVSIGRIGLTHPDLVTPHLPEFAQAWCQALYKIRDNEEKDSAFRGFCTLVQYNPRGPSPRVYFGCATLSTLLQGFKNHDVAAWQARVSMFPQPTQERLAARYGV
ncbi:Importin beta-2 subunit [Mycena indigotica]|uniref:Importin beta-2 subunit n=1 Tax=Mycena indigotica TaxID=2126181 RepID=A0A8H6S606_9AGAR|nr:Importin beta-2 subunit [Mycena indigotica]KAF7293413.1 Importin beta-2 subunit [Mycena indigotica]